MKKLLTLNLVFLILSVTTNLFAVTVDEDGQYVIIKTEKFELHWKKAAQMGYMEAFVGGSQDSIIGTAGRAFYHSSNYGGWKDWGALSDWEIVEEGPGKAVVKYESKDVGSKEYTCVASYYDSVFYIKHEVTVTAGAAVTSFESGHEPMFEVNTDIKGMKAFTQPFPHVAYWTKDGYFGATYGPDAENASVHDWGGRAPGRMQLIHNNLGKALKKGDSATVIYYVAFGEGGEKEATALAEHVQEEPSEQAVSPVGMLTTTWARIRARH